LTLLGKMAHDCIIGIGTVPGSIGVGEALKGAAVAGFDSIKPSLLDREAQAGMIETNQAPMMGRSWLRVSNGVPPARAAKTTAWAEPYRY
jgi:hypothetical protein